MTGRDVTRRLTPPWPHLLALITALAAVGLTAASLPASVRPVVLVAGLAAAVFTAVPRGSWASSVVAALAVLGLATAEPRPTLARVLAVVLVLAVHLWARATVETGPAATARLLPMLGVGVVAAVPVAWLGHQPWEPSLGWFLAGLVASLGAYVVVTRVITR